MKSVGIRLLIALVGLLAAAAASLYVREQRAELDTARLERDGARHQIVERDQVIACLHDNARHNAEQRLELEAARDGIAARLATIRRVNRRILDENATLRAWGDTPLPGDIARLHASPAFTGAGDYLARVPDGEPVHDAGDGTANQ